MNTIYTTVIKDFIENTLKNSDKKLSLESCIFVSGITGIGKTYNIKALCESLNLYIVNINSNNCDSSDKIIDIILKTINSSLYQIITQNEDKKIIVIDELDLLLSLDRTISISLLNLLISKKYKNIPIICICTPGILKKIGDIKKKCKIIELPVPTELEIVDILKKNSDKKTLKELKDIAKKSNGNLSCALKQITIGYENIIDINYDVEHLYTNNYDRYVFNNIIMVDAWLVPLRFHENLIIELNNNRKCTDKKKREVYKKFIKLICFFDLLMYKNHIDIAVDYFISTIYDITKLTLNNKNKSQMNNFTKILSYLSLQKKYSKQSYSVFFPLYQIGNYHITNVNKSIMYF